ncbi:MAG TPA: TIGR03905 family TSCPD domain-containing protein [Bacilli bacterium]|nr:TIGR03905 family TSCPD domain-containing protein [Bacilli bacterium]
METIEYTPVGVCSRKMFIDVENDVIKNYRVIGGCPGNSLGVGMLVKDQKIDDVIAKLKDIKCGARNTSCPAQLAKALIEYKNKEKTMN